MSSAGTQITLSVARAICLDPHLCALLLVLRGRHRLGDDFAIPDALAVSFEWPLRQLRGARARAIEARWIVLRSPPKRSQPALYAFGERCWRDLPDAGEEDSSHAEEPPMQNPDPQNLAALRQQAIDDFKAILAQDFRMSS